MPHTIVHLRNHDGDHGMEIEKDLFNQLLCNEILLKSYNSNFYFISHMNTVFSQCDYSFELFIVIDGLTDHQYINQQRTITADLPTYETEKS